MKLLQRPLLTLFETWQYFAVGIGLLAVVGLVVRTAQALDEITLSKDEVESSLARAVAECHALDVALGHGGRGARRWGRFTSWVGEQRHAGRRTLEITVDSDRAGPRTWSCEVLTGALPESLRRQLTLLGSFDARVLRAVPAETVTAGIAPGTELPRLDGDALARCEDLATDHRAFTRNDSIALLRLRGGTDRADYELTVDRDGTVHALFGPEGLLVLDGNLWIDRGDEPLRIAVDGPATIVVTGNVYVGRSLQACGDGRLTVFAMRVRNGSWTEGSGHLFLGLPEHGSVTGDSIAIDAACVVEGSCRLACRTARIAGALVVGGELAASNPEAALCLPGTRLPDTRERLPGLATTGVVRPGRLRLVDSTTAAASAPR